MLDPERAPSRFVRELSRDSYGDQGLVSHLCFMYENLTPRELAQIKREARNKRIANIRRRVIILGATLAAVFSGVALVRTEINQPAAGSPNQPTLAQSAPDQSDGESDGDDSDHGSDSEGLSGAVAGVVTSVLGNQSGDHSSTTPSTSAPAPSPQPTAPLTTSQS